MMGLKKEIKKLDKEIIGFEKGLKTELRFAEKWMVERRRFFIKLGWTAGVIIILLVLASIYS
jgi:hypothetical protein